MKKVLSLILAFVFVVGICASAPITIKVNAADANSLSFSLKNDGKSYYVSDCKEYASGELVIPSTYNGLPVTSIGKSAFSWCENLTTITIPDSVTYIVFSAFEGCRSLTSITIPDSVTSIGDDAFLNCSNLNAVYISDLASWCNIDFGDSDANPLYYARDLYLNGELVTELQIPEGVTQIRDCAFENCTSLTSVTIPDSVTSIGSTAFYYCTSLTSITIPDSVTSIGSAAFYNTAYYNDTNNWENDVLYIGNHLIDAKEEISGEYVIKDGTKTIADNAFYYCTALTSITIPDSVTSIGEDAFYNCTSLKSVTIGKGVTSIGEDAFYDTAYYNDTNNWENDVLYIGNHLIDAKTSLSGDYAIKSGTKFIANIAFRYCTALTSITIPDSVTSIGEDAFYNCTALTSITIPDSVTSIGEYAFYNCTALTSITIPDSVTSIGEHAFDNCTSLKSVTIGNGVTSIGEETFDNCTSLTSITIPDSVTSIGNYAFSDCTSIRVVKIGNGVKNIGGYAFNGCCSLTSITIGDNVSTIGAHAFYGCSALNKVYVNNLMNWCEIDYDYDYNYNYHDANPLCNGADLYLNGELVAELTIPEGVTEIKADAFNGCTSLTSITIPDSVTSIGEHAFYNCNELTSVTIGDSVTNIGAYAFYGCDSLSSIIFPNNVPNIGSAAFDACETSRAVYIRDINKWFQIDFSKSNPLSTYEHSYGKTYYWTRELYLNNTLVSELCIPYGVTQIKPYVFMDYDALTSVVIPDTVTSIGYSAFAYCDLLTEVYIPETVTNINSYAFHECSALTKVYYTGTEESWFKVDIGDNNIKLLQAEIVYNATTKPHEHTYTSSVTKQPSYTETGVKTFTCSCGDSYTEVIPKLEKFSAPTILSVTSETNGVKFTWDEVPGVTGYIVYKLVDGAYQQVAVQAPSNRVYVDKKAENGKTYSYIVASMDNIGNPCGKSEFTHTYKKLVSLATPTVTSANATNGIKVTWNAIENAETYTIYRRVYNESTKKYSGWTAIKTGYTGTSFTDTNVKFGIIYSYTVRAVNGDVRSNYKAATGTRVNVTPTVKVANASSGVKVTWNAVPNATGYTVYSASYNAKTKKWSGWTNRGTVKSGTTSWTDKKTKSGTYYKYTVRACYNSFKSSYKASDKIWYLAQPSVTVKAASNGVNVNWTQSAGAKTYTVYRAEYNAKTKTWSGWKTMDSLSKDKKSWTDKSAKKGVYYKYTVRAVNGNYKSTYKASANVKR